MKKKISFILTALLLLALGAQAQIHLEVVVERQNLPSEVAHVLENKIRTMMAQNGAVGRLHGGRFVLAVKTDVLNKEVLATAPTQYMQHLMLHLLVADGETGESFSATSLELKGVGKTEQASLMNAVRTLTPSQSGLTAFFGKATTAVKNYYDSKAAATLARIKALAAQRNYEAAMYEFSLIPYESIAHAQAAKVMDGIYASYLKQSSEQALSLMEAAWVASPNQEGAEEVYYILQELPAASQNHPRIKQLLSKIGSEMTRQKKAEEALEAKKVAAAVELSKARLQSMERIAKAYADAQPPRVYRYTFL